MEQDFASQWDVVLQDDVTTEKRSTLHHDAPQDGNQPSVMLQRFGGHLCFQSAFARRFG